MNTTLPAISLAILAAAGILAFLRLAQPHAVWRRLSLLLITAGLVMVIAAVIPVLIQDLRLHLPLYHLNGPLVIDFYLDRLAAFFILVISLVGICAAVYSLGYVEQHMEPKRRQWLLGLMAFFILAMIAVVASGNYFTLILSWEIMSLSSFFLVILEREQAENRKAGIYYLVMTQFSTVFLLFSCLTVYHSTGSMDITTSIPANIMPVALLGFLAGFGTKAGLMPLHKWLPYAHSAAPSNISALMSGVMLKTAIYGIIRIMLNLAAMPLWWGIVLLALGTASAVFGVIYALKEHDLKKLLAYHSIENIGIIVTGLGLYTIFTWYGIELLAVMSLTGALFHSLNHALFKSLLFMTAGNVINATRSRNIEHMGGLVKRMPATAATFLIGAAAISALPPLNGFASEILLFQSYLGAFQIPSIFVAAGVFASLAAFALMSALAAACFVKAFGITFLAMPRSPEAALAREAGWSMTTAPAILAGLCIAAGAGSARFFKWAGLELTVPDLLPVGLIILFVICILFVFMRLLKAPVRKAETWNCGQTAITSRTEYTATGFSEPIITIFSPVFRTQKKLWRNFTDAAEAVIRGGRAEITTLKFFEERIYLPLVRLAMTIGRKISTWQNGDLDNFIMYAFIAIAASILLAGWWL